MDPLQVKIFLEHDDSRTKDLKCAFFKTCGQEFWQDRSFLLAAARRNPEALLQVDEELVSFVEAQLSNIYPQTTVWRKEFPKFAYRSTAFPYSFSMCIY